MWRKDVPGTRVRSMHAPPHRNAGRGWQDWRGSPHHLRDLDRNLRVSQEPRKGRFHPVPNETRALAKWLRASSDSVPQDQQKGDQREGSWAAEGAVLYVPRKILHQRERTDGCCQVLLNYLRDLQQGRRGLKAYSWPDRRPQETSFPKLHYLSFDCPLHRWESHATSRDRRLIPQRVWGGGAARQVREEVPDLWDLPIQWGRGRVSNAQVWAFLRDNQECQNAPDWVVQTDDSAQYQSYGAILQSD